MSWGGGVKGFEDAMEVCSVVKDVEERGKTARAWYQILKNALEKAMSSDPEILFVAAAGNSNSDSSFNETAKARFRPILLCWANLNKPSREVSEPEGHPVTGRKHCASGRVCNLQVPTRDPGTVKIRGSELL